MPNQDETIQLGRRRALKMFGLGLTAAGGLIAVACNKAADAPAQTAAPKAPEGAGLCQFKVPTDDAAKAMRRTLQYREKSNQDGKRCELCSQFEKGKYAECGGCKLFAGGVNPQGVCLSFAPIGAAPAPGAPAVPGAVPAAPATPGKPG